MWQTLVNAWRIPDLRKKLLFTLLVIVIYRFGSVVLLVPYVNLEAVRELFDAYMSQGNMLAYFNILTGGALSNATIFAMSITPYINAQIIIQLLTVAIPALERLAKDGGEEGRKKLASVTRYTTVGLGLLQGFTYYILLNRQSLLFRTDAWSATVIILCFTAGSALMMWLGEHITEKGIGNGVSILLFISIISRIPSMVSSMYDYITGDLMYILYFVLILAAAVLIIAFIIFMTDAERRVPIQYAKRMVGRKMYGGQSTNLPMKVNMSGVMPIIFASTLMMFPGTIIQFMNPQAGTFLYGLGQFFSTRSIGYAILYVLLILGFGYFYAAIQFNPVEVANNLKKNGGFVMGYRPGKPTSDFLAKILSKITFIGSVFLSIVAVIPILVGIFFPTLSGLAIGGTSLLIIVGVALETAKQLEAQMMMRHYKGFLE